MHDHKWPYFEADEIEAASATLRSGKVNYWTGSEGISFEREFSNYCNTKYSVALSNGTVALEAALHSIGIGPGDDVIVPSRTFIASASCVIMRGGIPVVADVDSDSQTVTVDSIKKALTPNTKAVIAVHLAGWPCDMDPIMKFANKHNLWVIEDCAQSHGATYKGKTVGSLGHVAAFSFCQDKIMTTGGEGGMLTTNHKGIWRKAWSFKEHGKNYTSVFRKRRSAGFRWLHDSFGTNWRLTEMQSAIGRVQLKKLPLWLKKRRQNASILTKCFSKIPVLRVTIPPGYVNHSYYKYYVFVRPELLKRGWTRDRIMNAINTEGVICGSGSCSEIYLEKAFLNLGLDPSRRLPAAKELGETSLMFMVHPTLGKKEMLLTCEVVKKILSRASR